MKIKTILLVAVGALLFALGYWAGASTLIAHSQTIATSTPAVATSTVSALDARASVLADAIYSTEGRCTAGQSGEYGCYQYLPQTWDAYSIDVADKVLPRTAANERMVTKVMIETWLAEGVTDRGVFLTWNQGSATGWGGGTDCYKGVNDYGVAYNSCSYATRALQYVASHTSKTSTT